MKYFALPGPEDFEVAKKEDHTIAGKVTKSIHEQVAVVTCFYMWNEVGNPSSVENFFLEKSLLEIL